MKMGIYVIHMGGKAFKRRLVHCVSVATAVSNNFVLLLKSFITNNTEVKCPFKNNLNYLAISSFSGDFIKTEIDKLMYVYNIHTSPGY